MKGLKELNVAGQATKPLDTAGTHPVFTLFLPYPFL
jgi:hypothetical protein